MRVVCGVRVVEVHIAFAFAVTVGLAGMVPLGHGGVVESDRGDDTGPAGRGRGEGSNARVEMREGKRGTGGGEEVYMWGLARDQAH